MSTRPDQAGTGPADSPEKPRASMLTVDRVNVAIDASYELESLGDLLIERSDGADDFVMRTVGLRVKALACIVMNACNSEPPGGPLSELRQRLTGLNEDGSIWQGG